MNLKLSFKLKQKQIILSLLIVIVPLFSFSTTSIAAIPEEFSSQLTIVERYFLTNVGVIRVHNETDWAPFNFNERGVPKGFSIDYMTLLAQKTGLEVKFINGPSWNQFLDMIKQGELDIMLNIAKSPEREQFLEYTSSYVSMIQMLYTRANFPTVSSIKELYGKRFAVPKGFFFQEILRKNHPPIKIVEVPDTSASIRAVSVGKADALFDLAAVVDYITNKIQITNLKVGGELGLEEIKPIPLHIAVRKDMKVLASILEKGMKTISEEEIGKLHEKWFTGDKNDQKKLTEFTALSKSARVVLSNEEQEFIDNNIPNKKIRLGVDTALPPFEYIDKKGIYSGISADFIIEAANRLGIEVVPQIEIKWTEAIEKVKTGEIDVIPKVTPSAEREQYMSFTTRYISFPSVIVSRKDQLAGGLQDLYGLKVGVIKGQIIEANLKRDYPELSLVSASDIGSALVELSKGKFDVFIDNLGAVAHAIEHHGLVNLRIVASTPYNHDLAFGVRKDWQLLASALNKALVSMSEQEKTAIKNRWLAIQYHKGIDWWIVGPVGALLLCIIAFVILWNRRLGLAIKEREHAERKINAMGQAMADALVMINAEGKVLFWNNAAEKLFGYTYQEAINNDFHEMAAPSEMIDKIRNGLKQFAATGEGVVFGNTIETTARSRTGTTFPVEVSLSHFQLEGEWFAVGSVRDITERKKAQEVIIETAKQHRTIFESSPLGMIHMSIDGTIINCNEKFVDLMGSTREKLIGFNSLRKGRDEGMKAALRKALAGETADYEADYTSTTGGKTVPLHMKFNPVNAGENPTEVIVTLEDITDRRRAEQQMKSQMKDLERFSRLTINREERMIQLKEEINQLRERLGKEKKYKIVE